MKNQSQLKSAQIKYLVEGLQLATTNNHFWYQGTHYNQIKGVAIGARYAPSIAKLVLNKWEQEFIYKHQWEGLKLYKRYIDDVVLLWEGSEGSLVKFIQLMNVNNYGLRFTAVWNNKSISYLDLVLTNIQNKITTHTYFKDTDRNGYDRQLLLEDRPRQSNKILSGLF